MNDIDFEASIFRSLPRQLFNVLKNVRVSENYKTVRCGFPSHTAMRPVKHMWATDFDA